MLRNTQNTIIAERYTDQPTTIPPEIRKRIETAWNNEPVQLYAVADLDASLNLARTWIALGPTHIAIVREASARTDETILSFPRSRVKAVAEAHALSCTILTLQSDPGEAPLAVLRYTHRQRRAVGNILFILQQQIAGHSAPLSGAADTIYVQSIASPILDAQASVTRHRMTIVWRLLSYLKPYRTRVILGMTGAVLMTIVSLVPPLLTGKLIDQVVRPFESGSIDLAAASRIGWITIAGITAAYLLREVFAWVRLRTMAVLGEHVARDLRTHLYEHLHRLSVSYFSSKQTGSIISRVSSDTDRIWDFIAFGVVEVSLSMLMLLGLGGVLIYLDWPLGLLMAIPVPFLLFLIYRNGVGMQRMFLRAWRKWSNLTDVLSDTIPGIRVVKAFNQEGHEKRRFGDRNTTVTNEFFRIHHSWTTFWPGMMMLLHLVTILVWVFAMPRMLGGAPDWMPQLTAGTFVSFMLYMGMFFQPIEIFGQMSRMLNRSISSAHRIFEVLDTEPQMTESQKPVVLSPVRGHVVFENVTFGYDPVRQILKGITFDVRPGEMVGLVGPSGAGKTTVINLIARFYDITGGRILVDGIDIRNLELGSYRQQIGMVLQDPYLFHGTILDNIRYGMPSAGIAAVVAAAKAANAHEFIAKLPHGYDTVVGERGHTLSGGERQRVSIARAILHDPRILILDEATSSVDTETERKIQQALDRLIAGRTVFAIAHRLSTLTRASRLFVVKEGELVEQGTHAELLNNADGVYKKLHDMQRELHEAYAI